MYLKSIKESKFLRPILFYTFKPVLLLSLYITNSYKEL